MNVPELLREAKASGIIPRDWIVESDPSGGSEWTDVYRGVTTLLVYAWRGGVELMVNMDFLKSLLDWCCGYGGFTVEVHGAGEGDLRWSVIGEDRAYYGEGVGVASLLDACVRASRVVRLNGPNGSSWCGGPAR